MSESRQRWRLVFRRERDAMYLAHLDAIHSWERALRRGAIPVAVTEGFNPRPKLAFAAPLQLGMLAEHELADLYLAARLTAPDLRERLAGCLPRGYVLSDLYDVWVGAAAVAPQLVAADYRATVVGVDERRLHDAVARLLAADTLLRERRRETKIIRYDLRPLVMRLSAGPADPAARGGEGGEARPAAAIRMRLRHSQDGGTGRMEEVVSALAEEMGLRFSWTGSDDGESQDQGSPGLASASDSAAASAAVGAGRSPTTSDLAPDQIDVFMPVRERLWLAGELSESAETV